MSTNATARVYATSLADIVQEAGTVEKTEEEISFIADLFREDMEFRMILTSPGLTRADRKSFVDKIFSGRVSESVVNFLKVLIDHGRETEFSDIHLAFRDACDDILNRSRVTVQTPVALDDSTRSNLVSSLEKKSNNTVILQEEIDESLLGGVVIKMGDLVVDGSLAKDLKALRENLLSSKVRSDAAYED